jgi:hypothetical protein
MGVARADPLAIPLRPLTSPLLYFASTTHRRLAGVLDARSSIPFALSFAKGSGCFCTRFGSSSSTPLTPTPDPVADFHRPPVSSLLCTSHRRQVVPNVLGSHVQLGNDFGALSSTAVEFPHRRRRLPSHRPLHQ